MENNKPITVKSFTIYYGNDPSVGVFPSSYKLEGDFIFENEEELKAFKRAILGAYEWVETNIGYIYTDDELLKQEHFTNPIPSEESKPVKSAEEVLDNKRATWYDEDGCAQVNYYVAIEAIKEYASQPQQPKISEEKKVSNPQPDVKHVYNVGDIVPYTNTRGNTKMAEITEFKQIDRNGKWWFYGIDTVTKANVYYPEHLSRKLAELLNKANEPTKEICHCGRWLENHYLCQNIPIPSEERDNEDSIDIKNLILNEYEKGNIVISDFDGLKTMPLKAIVEQHADGLLYDINRNETVILTFIDDPKWINDYASTKIIRELKKQLDEKEPINQKLLNALTKIAEWNLNLDEAGMYNALDDITDIAIKAIKQEEQLKQKT